MTDSADSGEARVDQQSRPNKDTLVAAILQFLRNQDLLTVEEIRNALTGEIDRAGEAALLALREHLKADSGWTYYPPDPLARQVHHLLADRFLLPGSYCDGTEPLARLGVAPVVIFSNHLSYADANVIEVLLQRAGADALASRLTAIAGPKIFTSRERRFSSLCFGTIKVPQSTEVSSGEAVLNAREVARAARQSIDAARSRLVAGDALLLFGEGTRSRTGAMQPMLAGVARYIDVPGTWILPAGLAGAEQLFPVEDAALRPALVTLRLGAPFKAETLMNATGADRRVVVDAIGLAVAELLPVAYRGTYGVQTGYGTAAKALHDVRNAPA